MRHRTLRETIEYLQCGNVAYIEPEMSPNNPDLNQVDYAIWGYAEASRSTTAAPINKLRGRRVRPIHGIPPHACKKEPNFTAL